MSSPNKIKCIHSIEERFPVEQWTIQNIHVWPVIRLSLWEQLVGVANNKASESKHPPSSLISMEWPHWIRSLFTFMKASALDPVHKASSTEATDVVFLSPASSRQMLTEKGWYNRHCDPIADLLEETGFKTCLWEYDLGKGYRVPRYRKSSMIQPSLDFCSLRNRCKFLFGYSPACHLPGFEQVLDWLKTQGAQVPPGFLTSFKRQTNLILEYASLFKQWLVEVRPKACFVVCYYSNLGMALSLAARSLKIPCVDIQHGIQGSLHFAYGRWCKLPAQGYELLPDVFWVWGEDEARVIEQWCKEVRQFHRPFVGGNLWIHLWKQPTNPFALKHQAAIDQLKQRCPAKSYILVTLQPDASLTQQIDWLRPVMKSDSTSHFWLMRLHPRMAQEQLRLQSLLSKEGFENFNIQEASQIPLPAWLQNIDLHVTRHSSCVLEAEQFGVTSVVGDPISKEYYREQINRGSAVAALDSQDFVQTVNRLTNQNHKKNASSLARENRPQLDVKQIMGMLSGA